MRWPEDRLEVQLYLLSRARKMKRVLHRLPNKEVLVFSRGKRATIWELCALVTMMKKATKTVICTVCAETAASFSLSTLTALCPIHSAQAPDSLQSISTQCDPIAIAALLEEARKRVRDCDCLLLKASQLKALRSPTCVAQLLDLVKAIEDYSNSKRVKGYYYPKLVMICPISLEYLHFGITPGAWRLPCKAAFHAICGLCYQKDICDTCPLDGSSVEQEQCVKVELDCLGVNDQEELEWYREKGAERAWICRLDAEVDEDDSDDELLSIIRSR